MRILILYHQLYPDSIGGIERRNIDLAAALSRRGHEVTLAGFGRGLPGHDGVAVHSFGDVGPLYGADGKRSTAQAIRFAWYVFRLDVSRFDVVEAANIPYVHLVPLAIRCALSGTPLLVTWYEYWGTYWKKYVGRWSPLYRLGEWVTSQLGSAVTAISRMTADRLAAARKRSDEVHIIPCGVHLDEVRASAQGVVPDRRTIVFAGRLIAEKQVTLLIRAMARLRELALDVRLIVFGEGPELSSLRELVRCLALGDRVELRGHVPDSHEMWRTIKGAAIAVQPSSREGFGMFPLEAMALGVPVVYCSSPDNAMVELVRDGREGLCVAPDVRAIADAIARLLRDDDERRALGANAAARAAAFDWREIAQTMESLMTSIAKRDTGRSVAQEL